MQATLKENMISLAKQLANSGTKVLTVELVIEETLAFLDICNEAKFQPKDFPNFEGSGCISVDNRWKICPSLLGNNHCLREKALFFIKEVLRLANEEKVQEESSLTNEIEDIIT